MAGTPSDNPEDAHTDLMALIKAAREMPPDMDRALAESYMDKHKLASSGTPQQAVVAQTGQRAPEAITAVGGIVIGVVVLAAYITAVIVSQGNLWWLLFPLMAFGFGGWRGHEHQEERHRMRAERQLARDQWRQDRFMARMGYPPQQHEQQLPTPQPQQNTWTPPAPPAPQPTASTPPSPAAGTENPPANPAG